MSDSQEESDPPAEFASVSDQGIFQTCTRHALAKCACDGCQKAIFPPGVKIDLNQKKLITGLIKLHPSEQMIGKWPHEYHNIQIPGSFIDKTTGMSD